MLSADEKQVFVVGIIVAASKQHAWAAGFTNARAVLSNYDPKIEV